MKEPSVPSTNNKSRVPYRCIYIVTEKSNVYRRAIASHDTEWQLEKELGYVYASPVEGAIPLYEAENKNDYCYTTEDKQEYGTKGVGSKKALYVTQCPYNIGLPAKLKQLSG